MRHPKVRAFCWLVVLVLAQPFGARAGAAESPAALPPPFAVAPGQLAQTLAFGQAVTDTRGLTLTNSTTRPLTVTISELSGGFQALPLQAGQPPAPVLVVNQLAPQASAAAVSILTTLGYAPEAVTNADFEGRTVSNLLSYAAVVYLGRTGTTDTNPSNTKLISYLDAGGRLLIMDNDLGFYTGTSAFYRTYLDATFGADEPDPDGGSVALAGLDIMAGLSVPSADGFPDTFAAGASSAPILRYVFDNSVGGSRIARNSYKAVYVASDLHLLGTVAGAEPIEREIVQRSLSWLLGNPAADNLPWLAESPPVVSLPPSSSVNVAISWDASRVAQPGVYTGTLRLNASEAPSEPVNVPVRLTVNPNASQGRVEGTVTTRGLCDSAPAPLAGAQVRLSASGGISATVTTNASGRYSFYGPAATYAIQASAAGQAPASDSATVAAGSALTRDFALRLFQPCLGVAPASLSAALLIGQQFTRTITISNTGAAPLNYALSEAPGTTGPAADVPWLRETPASGTVAGAPPSAQTVSVVFDARSLTQTGTYAARIAVGHNGQQPAVSIPVSMEVGPPASAGQVSGSVEGLRGCDLPGSGLANAQVRFAGSSQTYTAATDSGGAFSLVLPAGIYGVSVSAAGYASQSGNATVAAGSQQVRNYSLRPTLPCLALPAASVTSLQAPNQVTTRTLAINNSGLAALNWALAERAFAPEPLAGPAPARLERGGVGEAPAAQAPAANQIQDGGFEATVSVGTNQFWSQSSSNFSGVLCSQARCGDGGGAGIGPRSGAWYAWLGGIDPGMATEIGTLSQNVIIPSGATTLSFWLKIAGSSQRPNDTLQVSVGATEVLVINAQAAGYGAYRQVNVPISQFANGASHRITFRGTIQEGGNTNFLIDDVVLDPAVRACAPNALPWVSVSPASGSVSAGGAASVAVAFNSAGLAPGTYAGTLCLTSNDSQRPEVSIPLTLTVRNQQDLPKLYLPLLLKP